MSLITIKKNRKQELLLSFQLINSKKLIKKFLQLLLIVHGFIMKYLWRKKFATLLLSLLFGFSFSLTIFGYPRLIQADLGEPLNPYVKPNLKNLPIKLKINEQLYSVQKTYSLSVFHYALAKDTAFLAPNSNLKNINYLLLKLNNKEINIQQFKLLKENNGWYQYKVTQTREIAKNEILSLEWANADCVVLLPQNNDSYLALIAKQL